MHQHVHTLALITIRILDRSFWKSHAHGWGIDKKLAPCRAFPLVILKVFSSKVPRLEKTLQPKVASQRKQSKLTTRINVETSMQRCWNLRTAKLKPTRSKVETYTQRSWNLRAAKLKLLKQQSLRTYLPGGANRNSGLVIVVQPVMKNSSLHSMWKLWEHQQ